MTRYLSCAVLVLSALSTGCNGDSTTTPSDPTGLYTLVRYNGGTLPFTYTFTGNYGEDCQTTVQSGSVQLQLNDRYEIREQGVESCTRQSDDTTDTNDFDYRYVGPYSMVGSRLELYVEGFPNQIKMFGTLEGNELRFTKDVGSVITEGHRVDYRK